MTDTMQRVVRATMARFRPPPNLPLAQWIEANVHIPATAGALPGRMRMWPYMPGLCEAVDDPDIYKVTVIKAARVGYTEWLKALLASKVVNDPALILALQPRDTDARDFSVDLEDMFEASPNLRGLLSDDADDGGRSTMRNRRFPGGQIRFAAAGSPANLRRITSRIVAIDECDAYEPNVDGDPVELATTRTLTIPDSLVVMGSTPTTDIGPISVAYAQSDKRVYEVKCTSCGDFSQIVWADIRWETGRPDTAHWVCPNNGCVIEESQKGQMVADGRWRATAPEVKGHAGFKITSLISPHAKATWRALVEKFIAAKGDPARLRVFVNNDLGEPWAEEGPDVDESKLLDCREPFSLDAIPEDVLWITAGADVQRDRIEVVLLGHGRRDVCALDHRVFWGPVDGDGVWTELNSLLNETWSHPHGGAIKVSAMAVDSSNDTDIVHAFTASRFGRKVVSIKGASGWSRPAFERSKGKGPKLWLIGVDRLKETVLTYMTRALGLVDGDELDGVAQMRFSETLTPIYFEQLAGERLVTRFTKGRGNKVWVPVPGRRNETLDCTVYALAVRGLINQSPDLREAELATAGTVKPVARPPAPRNPWSLPAYRIGG